MSMEFSSQPQKSEEPKKDSLSKKIMRKVGLASVLTAGTIATAFGSSKTTDTHPYQKTTEGKAPAEKVSANTYANKEDPAYIKEQQNKIIEIEQKVQVLKNEVDLRQEHYKHLTSMYEESLGRSVQTLEKDGKHKEAKKVVSAKDLLSFIEKYVKTVRSQAPENASDKDIVKVVNDHVLDYSNPETGEMIRLLQEALNHNAVGMTTSQHSEDMKLHKFLGDYSQYAQAYLDWQKALEKLNIAENDLIALQKSIPYSIEAGIQGQPNNSN